MIYRSRPLQRPSDRFSLTARLNRTRRPRRAKDQVEQDVCDPGHADAADADQIDVAYAVKHEVSFQFSVFSFQSTQTEYFDFLLTCDQAFNQINRRGGCIAAGEFARGL